MIHYKLLIFYLLVLPVMLITTQFFTFSNYDVYKNSAKSYKYNHACWVKEPIDVLIMGSSMGRHGIVPEIIAAMNNMPLNKVVNVAMNAATPWQNYNSYVRNMDTLKSASVVYYTLDTWMMNERYFRHSSYERVLWNFAQWNAFSKVEQASNNFFTPLMLYMNNLKVSSCRDFSRYNGYSPKPIGQVSAPSSTREKYYQFDELFGISDFEVQKLSELKTLIESNGSQFIFVLTPKHPFFMDARKKRQAFNDALIEKLQQKLGDIKIVGSMHAANYGLKDEDFFDNLHLSDSGARLFTAKTFADVALHKNLVSQTLTRLEDI